MSNMTWYLLKMIYIRQMVDLQRRTNFSDTLRTMGENYLQRILTYLFCTKCNELNMCHSNVQKHVSYKKKKMI